MFGSTFNTSNTLKERNEILEKENEFLDWIEFMQTQPKKEVIVSTKKEMYLITWEERAINRLKKSLKTFIISLQDSREKNLQK